MYSGFILLYGIQLHAEDIAEELGLLDSYFEDDIYEFGESVDESLQNQNFKFIGFEKLPCCYHTNEKVFLAVNIGANQVQFKDDIEEFEDFQTYHDNFQIKLDKIKKYYYCNKNAIEQEFDRLAEEMEFFNIKPTFFTIPDECGNC